LEGNDAQDDASSTQAPERALRQSKLVSQYLKLRVALVEN